MDLNVEIEEIKGLKKLNIKVPLEKGVYAICGENGCGKSTLLSCISSIFNDDFIDYLKDGLNTKSILDMSIDDKKVKYVYDGSEFKRTSLERTIHLYGFHEGSLIYGTRFEDASKISRIRARRILQEHLAKADEFVSKNLSYILHNNYDYYQDLYRIKNRYISRSNYLLKGNPYFIKTENGFINQFDFSTGEYLLVNLLHLINNLVVRNIHRRSISSPFLIMIDEVEFALHPSAIKRLVSLLKELANQYNITIYFSTHSVEIIQSLSPVNLFYLEKNTKGIVSVHTPCFPSYAVRYLYQPNSIDCLFLVEDEFAERFLQKIIDTEKLYTNKINWIIPCGSWEKTLELQNEFSKMPSFTEKTRIISILDGDIKADYNDKYKNDKAISSMRKLFLPVYSIEKYLYKQIIIDENANFINDFGNRFFPARSFKDILDDYKRNYKDKQNGKNMIDIIYKNMYDIGITRELARERIVTYVIDSIDTSKFKNALSEITS